MEFTRENVKEMAETMHLALSETEIDEVFAKVVDFSGNMELMMAEDVTGYEPFIMSTLNKNIFQTESEQEEYDVEHLKSTLNDFDGEYFVIKKVMEDE
ncbi:hypothetical protein RZE82_05885 [Mollicutes bacterium LVI A0039]|nr:hypothetical protein RZE82_05885 [Mollicutes bacterium LVI A0039]